ncbi:MAG TPA: hypothetical protein VER04_04325 [Polyangiaceae bacterium]|nr:hypothetical protein [Polyangiaceae bacterium]
MAVEVASADDMRDVPRCLRAVRVNPWRDAPETSGESVCYGTFEPGKAHAGEPQWFEVEPATGSDYSGGTVTLANQRELKRLLTESEDPVLPDCVWCTAYGGHGTYALFVVYAALPAEIREVLGALDDYPSVNDEALSKLECQLGSEAWEAWGRTDLRRALEKQFGAELGHLTDDCLFELFRVAGERMGHDWEFEQGAQAYFDFTRAARELSNTLDAPPSWLTDEQIGALASLRACISVEK